MSKQTASCFLFMSHDYDLDSNEFAWKPSIWPCKLDDSEDRVFIRAIDVVVDVPDDFDPTARQIAALEREREAIKTEFARRVNDINGRIAKLQAITYEVPA
jgi:hypothetical protein